MLDRESTFADAEIVGMLKSRFVPVAIDQAYQRRQQDAEGDFYRRIAGQGPRNNFRGTTQGLYVGTAEGGFLGYTNNRDPSRVKGLLRQALEKHRPGTATVIDPGKPDARYNPQPPEGGFVARVTSKVLGGYEETTDRWRKIFQSSLGRDNLWVRADEHKALLKGDLPTSLATRIARYHLVDNTRGEPPMWRPDEVKRLDLTLRDGRITGQVHLETASGDRGYRADIRGVVATKDGRVTRFDLVAKGEFWGDGQFTRGAPKGKFPFAVALTLADGSDAADRIPPQGSRGWVQGYIR